jgi:hypothetical protein
VTMCIRVFKTNRETKTVQFGIQLHTSTEYYFTVLQKKNKKNSTAFAYSKLRGIQKQGRENSAELPVS